MNFLDLKNSNSIKILVLGIAACIFGVIFWLLQPEPEPIEDLSETPIDISQIDFSNLSDASTVEIAQLSLQEDNWEALSLELEQGEAFYDLNDPELREELEGIAERWLVADGLGIKEEEFSYKFNYQEELPVASVTAPYLEVNPVYSVAGINWNETPKSEFPCTERILHNEEIEELDDVVDLCEYADWRNADSFQVYVLSEVITSNSVADFRSDIVTIDMQDDGTYLVR